MPKVSSPTATIADGPSSGLSETAIRYAAQVRQVRRETLEAFDARSGEAFFPSLKRRSEAVFFPYRLGGIIVGWKAAAFPEKAHTCVKGSRTPMFNLDAVKDSPVVHITEGEWDCLALVEAGLPIDQVASVPGGADAKRDDEDQFKTFKWAKEAMEAGLAKAKRIVWCGDMDLPGIALRRDMAAVFGAATFHFVDWPETCKDANDVLRRLGAECLSDLIRDCAQPWPLEGVYTFDEMPEEPPLTVYDFKSFRFGRRLRIANGNLSVFTGRPGHGKTSLSAQMFHDVARDYDLRVAIASFETRAKPSYRRLLRNYHLATPEADQHEILQRKADAWINDHYRVIQPKKVDPSLPWILDAAEALVVREGVSIVKIDPFNRLESQRAPRESETDYILRCLKLAYNFAHDMNCHVQILAHPAKMEGNRRGKPPTVEDISGSQHWGNIVDQAFAVHRPKTYDPKTGRCFDSDLYHDKARYEETGYPSMCKIKLNVNTARFESVNDPEQEA